MEQSERLTRQFDFIREIDKEKFIGRQTYLSDGERKENDAEHAWHMAIMTILLSEYANEEIDVLKTVTMLLIHDIVEIDAGDTYAYDEEAKKTQKEREEKAAERIFGLLPADQREEGTLATTVYGMLHGCSFVRVHDVAANRRAIQMTEAIVRHSS